MLPSVFNYTRGLIIESTHGPVRCGYLNNHSVKTKELIEFLKHDLGVTQLCGKRVCSATGIHSDLYILCYTFWQAAMYTLNVHLPTLTS